MFLFSNALKLGVIIGKGIIFMFKKSESNSKHINQKTLNCTDPSNLGNIKRFLIFEVILLTSYFWSKHKIRLKKALIWYRIKSHWTLLDYN